MSVVRIEAVDDVYGFVNRLKAKSEASGNLQLATQLHDAMRLGSSGLEILGAIRQIILKESLTIEKYLGADGTQEAIQIVTFVDKAYGRKF